MRTREEQIEAAAEFIEADEGYTNMMNWMRSQIEEAEQRVRAEIARDSERLDWLSEDRRGLASHASMGTYVVAESGETYVNEDIRVAIDAAREVE